MELFYFLSNLTIWSIPLAIAMYKETRFTGKEKILAYGLVSILFPFVFYLDPSTVALDYSVKILAFQIFLSYGIISSIVGGLYLKRGWKEGSITLLFSGRYFAALQLPFWLAQLGLILPRISSSPDSPVIQWGLTFIAFFAGLHVFVFMVKNHKLRLHKYT